MASSKILGGVAFAALSLAAGGAHAQSTASQIAEDEIVVTATAQRAGGLMREEIAAKARATITQEYIEALTPGQTVLETINLVPGVNFSNTDAYGSSGGSLVMRGFDNQRISLTFDGVPLNDSGNYAIYSNQQLDSEIIERVNVNLGTTDVDSPTASAVGGTVNYVSRLPSEEAGLTVSAAAGSENFSRLFGMIDFGEFGPWGTTAYLSASAQQYDQFIGTGDLAKTQYNGRIYQPLGDNGDFMSLAFHYNENRNDFYYRFNRTQWQSGIRTNIASCSTLPGGPGAQNSANDGCSGANSRNYYGQTINPSDTGNIRGQSRFTLSDSLTFTFDPSFQYVRANGGGTSVIAENSPQLIANTGAAGVDLNHDGDFLDSVRLFSPSNTATYRYMATTSLLWDINDNHRVRVGYTFDEAQHRQTGEYGYLNSNGDPENVFGGRLGQAVILPGGGIFQKRNRSSVASLNQWSAEYRGDFLDDALTLVLGFRAPQFERALDQTCYARRGSTSSTQYCTSQTPLAAPSPGFVRFDLNGDGDVLDAGETNDYAPPFEATVRYDDILPNVGATYRLDDNQQVFLSYAEGISAPQTDDLYGGILVSQLGIPEPETTRTYDLGYRYSSAAVMGSIGLWYSQFSNRIESSVDPDDPATNIRRNVGDVDLWGVEVQGSWQVTDAFLLYGSGSWTDSEVKLTGRSVVDTPDYKFVVRGEYETGPFSFGAQARYVGERFANDANTEVASTYTVVDVDASYSLASLIGADNAEIQFNVINLFDEEYFGQLSSGTGWGAALYNLGAPQTFMVTMRAEF